MNKFILIILLAFISGASLAQAVVGFWEIKEVKVGDETMTPIARWTRINKDGSYQSGNGWQQNSEGTWKYNSNSHSFLPDETNGIKEPYGAFQVSFDGKNMIWHREEDGMPVKVTLVPIEKLPKSTADKIVGLWDLTQFLQDDSSIKNNFAPKDKYYIFIRWDKIYVKGTPEGKRVTGYWHINAHRPEVTFLSHEQGKNPESWQIEVTDNELKLTGISDSNKNKELLFQRINEFPN
eukprot:gnl/Carplike_NY0171/1877_a2546_676.p1 GENE.gnl/Carplike_NY0171/1877_a2546_676~~gnl/Carplike_NY0171/1877_a2546_676.p1  ORF type:complete len:236 (+),score=-9.57 gnl/Carplike_NY0171/1877_a2546_676:30-737(+)